MEKIFRVLQYDFFKYKNVRVNNWPCEHYNRQYRNNYEICIMLVKRGVDVINLNIKDQNPVYMTEEQISYSFPVF